MAYQGRRSRDGLTSIVVGASTEKRGAAERYSESRRIYISGLEGIDRGICVWVVVAGIADQIEAPDISLQIASIGVVSNAIAVVISQARRR